MKKLVGISLLLLAFTAVCVAGGITLFWPANSAQDKITSYRVYQAKGTNAFVVVAEVATNYWESNSIVWEDYYQWRVTAVNALGEGDPSNTVGAGRPGKVGNLLLFSVRP